ncbi:hypothetical protein MMC16_005364 [Acarospora aff. strigata]|nr:hypothetical protein [Acarospora aff. strigata]
MVIWKKGPEGDWWHRDGAVYNKHGWKDYYHWNELQTVDVYATSINYLHSGSADALFAPSSDTGSNTDVKDETVGKNRRHPKVYVGFHSHSPFPNRDITSATQVNTPIEGIANDE